MWSDDFDKRLRDSSEDYNPPYEEKGWEKMELLLEKHLPQKKRRRRFLFWLLPMAAAVTAFVFVLTNNKQPAPLAGNEKSAGETITTPQANEESQESITGKKISRNQESISKESGTGKGNAIKAGQEKEIRSGFKKEITKDNETRNLISNRIYESINRQDLKNIGRSEKIRDAGIDLPAKETTGENQKYAVQEKPEKQPTGEDLKPTELPIEDHKASYDEKTEIKEERNLQEDSSGVNRPKANPVKSGVGILFSAGPDISIVGIDNPGRWRIQYGVGLSYSLSQRLDIRTGFLKARKVYTAKPGQYHSGYTPHGLKKVEADCNVYEIPVTVLYHFGKKGNRNWFAAAGLSSFVMKEEIYNYYYLNSWGQMQQYTRTYKNKNNHVLTVLNFSAGYRYRISRQLSALAEPYVKIPLSGIGNGKVMLNSTGIQLSVSYHPFSK